MVGVFHANDLSQGDEWELYCSNAVIKKVGFAKFKPSHKSGKQTHDESRMETNEDSFDKRLEKK